MKQSLTEYVRELLGGYRSVVAGVVLEVLGFLAIFWSDARALHAIGVAGVAAGFIVAPFLAFHRMRLQRDGVAGSVPQFRQANLLSFGNWSLDSFSPPRDEEGLAARAMVAVQHAVGANAQLTPALADRLAEVLESSPIDGFLSSLAEGERRSWQLVSPTNDGVITAVRDTEPLGEGWEAWARCVVQLPRPFASTGPWPCAAVDAGFRPAHKDPGYQAHPNPASFPVTAGAARLNLFQLRDLLASLADTAVEEIVPLVFPPVVEWTRRERLLARWRSHGGLRLIGPNFDVRSRPRVLIEMLEMPQLTRRAGAPTDTRLWAETPAGVDSYERQQRKEVIVQGITRSLRQHEYADVESFEVELER